MGRIADKTTRIARLQPSRAPIATAADYTIENLESRLLLTQTIYVDASSPDASGNGSSWDHAFRDLQLGLAAATAGSGDEIHVANGMYFPTSTTDRTISFVLKSGTSLLGGYAGYGAADPNARDVAGNATILSGDIGISDDNADNAYHVVLASNTNAATVFDGFTITAGRANGPAEYDNGAGIYNSAGSLTISHCTISTNTTGNLGFGGGLYNLSASPVVTNCIFRQNTSSGFNGSGGGLYNSGSSPTFYGCTFTENLAYDGGGLTNSSSSSTSLTNCTFRENDAELGGGLLNVSSFCTLTNCNFSGNSAGYGGGGLYTESTSPVTLNNCIFTSNLAAIGGGAFVGYYNSIANLTGCTFTRNFATFDGGALYAIEAMTTVSSCKFIGNSSQDGGAIENFSASQQLTNCIIAGNSATLGGAIYNYSHSNPVLYNCVLSGNVSTGDGSAIYSNTTAFGDFSSPVIKNSIIWANTNPSGTPIFPSPGSTTARNSDIQGGFTGTGNINADPLFVREPSPGPDSTWGTADDDYGDLRLRATSPCIDTGDNSFMPGGVSTDLAGNARIVDFPGVHDPGAIVDMGPYERAVPFNVSTHGFTPNSPQGLASFTFSGQAIANSLQSGDLLLLNRDSNQLQSTAGLINVNYDSPTHTGIWTVASFLPDGNYRATLPIGSITGALGDPLDSDDSLDFFILAGDANNDRYVNTLDFTALAANFGQTDKKRSDGDFNGDGAVNSLDFNALASKFGTYLAPVAGESPIGGQAMVVPMSGAFSAPNLFGRVAIGFKNDLLASADNDTAAELIL